MIKFVGIVPSPPPPSRFGAVTEPVCPVLLPWSTHCLLQNKLSSIKGDQQRRSSLGNSQTLGEITNWIANCWLPASIFPFIAWLFIIKHTAIPRIWKRKETGSCKFPNLHLKTFSFPFSMLHPSSFIFVWTGNERQPIPGAAVTSEAVQASLKRLLFCSGSFFYVHCTHDYTLKAGRDSITQLWPSSWLFWSLSTDSLQAPFTPGFQGRWEHWWERKQPSIAAIN